MEASSVEAIVKAFNANGVRYLIAGGLAVVAHGYVRFTADMDLIVDLDPANLTQAIRALADLDYRPRAPVFSLFSPRHPATEIDIFVEMPLDFERAYQAAARMEIAAGVTATFVGFEDLLRLKQQAGRPQDRLDVEKLTALRDGSTDE